MRDLLDLCIRDICFIFYLPRIKSPIQTTIKLKLVENFLDCYSNDFTLLDRFIGTYHILF